LAGSQGDAFLESAWHDPDLLAADPTITAGYRKPLMADNWDRALWEHTKASSSPDLEDRLDQITIPTLVISGDDDQIVPLESSIRLANDIPGAILQVIPNCGHLPQEECPSEFIQIIEEFLMIAMENQID
jgi:pimeloyl-ACP methyl ester carboxylesterase